MESLLPPKSLMRTGQGPDTVQGSRFLLGPDRWLGPAAARGDRLPSRMPSPTPLHPPGQASPRAATRQVLCRLLSSWSSQLEKTANKLITKYVPSQKQVWHTAVPLRRVFQVGEARPVAGAEYTGTLRTFPQYCCEHKTALKSKVDQKGESRRMPCGEARSRASRSGDSCSGFPLPVS